MDSHNTHVLLVDVYRQTAGKPSRNRTVFLCLCGVALLCVEPTKTEKVEGGANEARAAQRERSHRSTYFPGSGI